MKMQHNKNFDCDLISPCRLYKRSFDKHLQIKHDFVKVLNICLFGCSLNINRKSYVAWKIVAIDPVKITLDRKPNYNDQDYWMIYSIMP